MKGDEVFENYHFIVNKKLLMIMCIWPYQKRSLKLLTWTTIIIAIHTMMIPQMIRTYEEFQEKHKNMEIIAENIAGFFYFQGVLSKLYMSIYAGKKLQHLYEIITKDYKEIQDPEERAAMIELWNFARILSIIYASYMFTACFFFVFTPVAIPAVLDIILPMNESRTKTICYYAQYYIDQEKYLYYLVAHTFIGVSFTLFIISAVDTSFIAVTYHALGLFNLITRRLKILCERIDDGNYHENELHNFVVDTIKIHKKTIDFADIVRITYNECFFFITFAVLVVLSIGTIDVVTNLQKPSVLLRIGFVYFGLIAYMFFTSWPGQRFIDSSGDLLQSVYCCNWYKLPLKTQFLVRVMMMRCLIPCQLTAGPLLQMNFTNCGVVLKTAMSYFTTMASLS